LRKQRICFANLFDQLFAGTHVAIIDTLKTHVHLLDALFKVGRQSKIHCHWQAEETREPVFVQEALIPVHALV
jgi:hypothetical protein